MGGDTTNARGKNCGMIVQSFVGISGNCGETDARADGEKSRRIDESSGRIDENSSAMRGSIDGKRPDGDVCDRRTNKRDEGKSENEPGESPIPSPTPVRSCLILTFGFLVTSNPGSAVFNVPHPLRYVEGSVNLKARSHDALDDC
jgi:hypothetical protein